MDSTIQRQNSQFQIIALTVAGMPEPSIAVAATRAGELGVLDLEYTCDVRAAKQSIEKLRRNACGRYGIKVSCIDAVFVSALMSELPDCIEVVIITGGDPGRVRKFVDEFHRQNRKVILEATSLDQAMFGQGLGVDGLLAKGNEAAGIVGEKTSFILLQQLLSRTNVPVFAQGGIGLHTAAACYAAGAAGIVLDTQLLLTRESPLPEDVKKYIVRMNGTEPHLFAENTEAPCRLYVRRGSPRLEDIRKAVISSENDHGQSHKMKASWQELIRKQLSWNDTDNPLWLLGQDTAFAAPLTERYGTVGSILRAIRRAVDEHIKIAKKSVILQKDSPLARSHGTSYPIVQGPMARITDSLTFASLVADGGALPVVALAMLREEEIKSLLRKVKGTLGGRPWGVGILGFNKEDLLREQVEALSSFSPPFAIIAGGLPNQISILESRGIAAYVHVPSPDILDMFLQSGSNRFIFEGSECGGHIGPRSSFVLWEIMTEKLLEALKTSQTPDHYHVLYAGGIHDSLSASMVAAIAAPLARLGVRIGVQMGTAYLLTSEIVESGALRKEYQKKVLECFKTSVLEFSPGHAVRCCGSPLAEKFEAKKRELVGQGAGSKEISAILEQLILGKSRIAAKGFARNIVREYQGTEPSLVPVDSKRQHEEGLYMVGQLAALHDRIQTISALHEDVTTKASEKLDSLLTCETGPEKRKANPSDIAIIGMACLFPKSGDLRTYWENILNMTNAITEIPPHRWDWRLYYDEDSRAKDKIYSKWGGFIEDLSFDPTRYGLPPKSMESIDPMQLMALEVARRTLADAGYEDRSFDRETASVILGASGGTGDVGLQYGLRAELPRFMGQLPSEVAERLPEWTEDTFAGILLNVISGRIANRLDLGGVNFSTDAACASSLAAIYQAVSELVSGRSSLVIAGGVDTVQGPFGYMCFSKTQALSPRGCCSTFDEAADGIVISEGIAMVALKRLEDAERDGDRIYAVIKGVGGSSDGRAKGLTAPLPEGQLRAMRRAYAQAGFGPDTVALFEAHGTGTVVGDTAELESTSALLRESGCRPRQAAVGSVKTLIGHAKAAAGIAGLIKSTLALYQHVLPPHAGVSRPNQVLKQSDSPLYLLGQPEPWLSSGNRPRRAAVSAFGFGGTNFHIVLEEYGNECPSQSHPGLVRRWPSELFLWHGSEPEELKAAMMNTKQELHADKKTDFVDIAFRLAGRYRAGDETVAVVAADADDLRSKIDSALDYLEGNKAALPSGVYHGCGISEGKTAVLFPGQGSQYTGMSRELALHFHSYAETLSEADRLLGERLAERFGGARLSHFIFPRGCYSDQARADATQALTSTDVAQPALGVMGAGLWKLMESFGLNMHMTGGHSYGEFTALFAGGAIDFDALMSLSEARGRFIVDAVKKSHGEFGTMAAVRASRQFVEKAISDIDGLVVANHNAPEQCVISGSTAAIELASEKIAKDGATVVKIPVAAAFHSRIVEPAQAALAELIGKTLWTNPRIPVYSNTTGEPHAGDPEKIRQVMTDHLVRPVEFVAQIEAMYRDGARVFLELGPKNVLTRLVGSILKGRSHKAIAIDGNGGGVPGMLHAFGQLLCAGVTLDPGKLFEGRGSCSCAEVHESSPADLKKIWLLNGSSARRASEPPKQVGIRLDELQSHEPNLRSREARPYSSSENDEFFQRRLASRKYCKGGLTEMPTDDKPVMSTYFDMMRQFLETQERVMQMYISGASNGRHDGSRSSRQMQMRKFSEEPGPAINRPAIKPEISFQPEFPAGGNHQNFTDGGIAGIPFVREAPAAVLVQPASGSAGTTRPTEVMAREEMSQILLRIIEEKTGYPPDMVGLTQNLEADLGIDSIKRVEIVGALMKTLPPAYSGTLGKDLGGLNTQSTLNGMLDILDKVRTEEGALRPFDEAGTGSATRISGRPFRHVMRPKQETIDGLASRRLGMGHFIITRDRLNVADKLSELLAARDCKVTILEHEIINDEVLLNQWCLSHTNGIEIVAGIVHLAQIGSEWLPVDSPLLSWRNHLQLTEKSLFILLHNFSGKLSNDAHVLSASSLGGFFSRREVRESGLSLQAGSVGLLKSLSEERPGLRVKAVDIDPEQMGDAIAASLMDELELEGGRQEVGYPGGKRTIFQTVAESVSQEEDRPEARRNMVILATGGTRGVTAELLREFALPGNTLILTGRTPLLEDDPEDLKSFTTPSALRDHFVSEVRSKRLRMTPAEIRNKIRSVLASREMRDNIKDFRKRGSLVEYHAIDVTNEEAMRKLVEAIYKKHSHISGVVHGAGIIEDKLQADKKGDSWSRVVETKVFGLLLLMKYLRPEFLRFFAVMSSVAGRYGNSGQTDYATANELMNRLCCQMSIQWGNAVTVKAFCWGPWGPTLFGSGMVTPETESKFAEKEISLVEAEAGRQVFKNELTGAAGGDVEIICGEGPWERREAAIGDIRMVSRGVMGDVSGQNSRDTSAEDSKEMSVTSNIAKATA